MNFEKDKAKQYTKRGTNFYEKYFIIIKTVELLSKSLRVVAISVFTMK